MKTRVKNQFLRPVLITSLGLMLADRLTAQTFTALHIFTTRSDPILTNGVVIGGRTNADGASPTAGLNLSGNILYGTAPAGGSSGVGTVFAVHINGTGFSNLHSFTATSGPNYTNSDGIGPDAELILSGNVLYGTAVSGGSSGTGTVFAINTDGTGFRTLHSFTATSGYPDYTNSDGRAPTSGLILSGYTLYGTAQLGGISGNGTVFKVNTDGTGFTVLHDFMARNNFTNSDGSAPEAGMILSGNTLYGTATYGGDAGNGTVFAINTDGTGFTNLHSFTARQQTCPSCAVWNSDGAAPRGGLILSGNTLYGTAENGGSYDNGTVFAVDIDGTGFTNLHNFTAASGPFGSQTNSDGAIPLAGLVLLGKSLYGTAWKGGSAGYGTVFKVNTDGTGFTNLHSFTDVSKGLLPTAALILSGNSLYGTATGGGNSDSGAVFALSFDPQLSIIPAGTNVILTWPTNVAGFDYTGYTLQSTTSLASPGDWTTVSPVPVVLNGQNIVTNPISGAQQFFRLKQ